MGSLEMILDIQSSLIVDLEREIVKALKFGDVATARRKRKTMLQLEEEKVALTKIWFRRAGR